MPRTKQPKPIHQMSIAQFEAMFPDEEACKAYLQSRRWPNGVRCPRCGNPAVYDLPSRKWHWQCTKCAPGGSTGYRFSVIAGTIFENTNKPLRDWFRVAHLMLTAKKGISARQVWRYMGFGSYKTAWCMGHRIRAALADRDFEKLGGIVEVDETFVGGLAKNRHIDKRGGGHGTGGVGSGKTPVAGAVSRKGNVVARVLANVRADMLTSFVCESVSEKVSRYRSMAFHICQAGDHRRASRLCPSAGAFCWESPPTDWKIEACQGASITGAYVITAKRHASYE